MSEQMTDAELAELRRMADDGDARLALKLGQYLRIFPERGAPGEFARWLALAAQGGQGEACWDIAEMFLFGTEVERDLTRARSFLELGAALSHPLCLYNLGVMRLTGEGSTADPAAAVALFRQAAALGEPNAWYNLGICCGKGIGTPVDLAAARHWLTRAAEAGDSRAPPLLAQLDQAEGGTPPTVTVNLNSRQAADLMRQIVADQQQALVDERRAAAAHAATQPPREPTLEERATAGEVEAMLELAGHARDQQRFEEAAAWLGKAADAGSAAAHYRLGQFHGCGGEYAARAPIHRPDWLPTRRHLAKAVELGLPAAASALAQVEQVISGILARIEPIRRRADAGEAAAQFDYAMFLGGGELGGSAADPAASLRYLELAARQGLAKAQAAIYHLFMQKREPSLERATAIGWLAKAALQQNREAMFWFAEHYSKGKITAADHPLAIDLFGDCRRHYPECLDPAQPRPSLEQLQAGAKQQRLESQYLLALRYADGDGVDAAPAQAIALLNQCIARGYAPAQYALARIHAMGAGVERDMEKARALALAAARQGHVPAFIELRLFGATPEEIAAVDRLRGN